MNFRKQLGRPDNSISNAFKTFMKEAPDQSHAWTSALHELDENSALDKKTRTLVYLAVLAALRINTSIPYYVAEAKEQGATREEIISAVLTGLPAAGAAVLESLPTTVKACDTSSDLV